VTSCADGRTTTRRQLEPSDEFSGVVEEGVDLTEDHRPCWLVGRE
jgi:hypothetical protein